MLDVFPLYLSLILLIVLLVMVANKLKVAYPVVLVLAGLLICLIPGLPAMHVNPDLIFVIFLPPLLYEAAWAISWKELWRWRRIIGSFAFVVVFLTAFSIALVANYFIPGFTLALGFLLGGIISPPDAVSASAILKFVKVPKRMSSILEGESLLNDASSLIIFRFAIIAVTTGQFIWSHAIFSFGWMLIGGVGVGLITGYLFMKAHKLLPTDVNMDIVLTIVTPYIMYIVAEEIHSSGVLAVVSGGLLLSYRRNHFLSSTSRLRGVNVWESLIFILNGLVFILIGLSLHDIVAGLGEVSLKAAIGYGLLVTAVMILFRILSAYGAVIVTLIMRNFITVADTRSPGFRVPLILGWTGMRGVVSLAAALSIPVQLSDGTDFPQRNLILFITFIAILTSLVLQGLTLPLLIRKLRVDFYDDYLPSEEAEIYLRKGLATASLAHLALKYPDASHHNIFLGQLEDKWKAKSSASMDPLLSAEAREIYKDILNHQRKWLLRQNRAEHHIEEDIIRAHIRQIDIEEEKLKFM